MAVFATFIKASPAGTFTHWQQRVAFGAGLPSGRSSGFVRLEVDQSAEAGLFAAFGGKLTLTPPTGFVQPGSEPSGLDRGDAQTLTLYVEPTSTKVNANWQAVCSDITARFDVLPTLSQKAHAVGYIEYRNVDAAAAGAVLGPLIESKKRDELPEDRWKRFLAGKSNGVLVKAGDAIGKAAPKDRANNPNGPCEFALGIRTRFGMLDPGTLYQSMFSVLGVQAPANADALAQFLGIRLPLIDRNQTATSVGNDRLWPWAALLQYKQQADLSYADWRSLGDLQKKKYMAQLVARTRPASAAAGVAPFEFDVDDMSNVFQLEAVAEFFINFAEPWDLQSQPVSPGSAGYKKLNFLQLYGSTAQINGAEVTLDAPFNKEDLLAGRDTIVLDDDTGRNQKQYRVVYVSQNAPKVTLDDRPQVPGGSSSWKMFQRPHLVMIDAFGSRVRGFPANTNGISEWVKLENLSNAQVARVRKVNAYETIEFRDTTSGTMQIGRILAPPVLTGQSATVLLEKPIDIGNNATAWAIPSGVGGIQGDIKPPDNRASTDWGWDQYDGMMFLVAGGRIRCFFPWTSYTSRSEFAGKKFAGTKYHSSIKGNRQYRFSSFYSQKRFINISFSVIDPAGQIRGNRETATFPASDRAVIAPETPVDHSLFPAKQIVQFINAGAQRFTSTVVTSTEPGGGLVVESKHPGRGVPADPSPFWIQVFDGVSQALFYFKPYLDKDYAEAGKPPGELGKGTIRIHRGGRSKASGSEGCQVSPEQAKLRLAVIEYNSEANASYYEENSGQPGLDKIPELHSVQDPPANVQAYYDLVDSLPKLLQKLRDAVAEPLSAALGAAIRTGSDSNERIEELNAQLLECKAQLVAALSLADDIDAVDRTVQAMETLTDLVFDEDVITAADWSANVENVSSLARQVREVKARIENEKTTWGWPDAVHGDYWLIRPDERYHA